MLKQKGFTLIELMVVFVIVGVVLITIVNIIMGVGVGTSVSWGINGVTEVRCIDGYRFVVGEHGQARQVLDEFGKGARCENVNPGKPGSYVRQ